MKNALKFSIIPVLLLACYIGLGISHKESPNGGESDYCVQEVQAEVLYTYMYSDIIFNGEIDTIGADNYKAVVQTEDTTYTVTLDKSEYESLRAGDTVNITIYNTDNKMESVELQ